MPVTKKKKKIDIAKIKKLSRLLSVALADLRKIERKTKTYKIDMYDWHCGVKYINQNKCHVCMAGAVIACELKANPEHNLVPECFNKNIAERLIAINELRTGDVSFACTRLNLPYTREFDRDMPEYGHKDFWPEMRKLVKDLSSAGY